MGGAGAADPQKALTLSSPVLRKLEEEASLLASLRHPNIVSPGSLCGSHSIFHFRKRVVSDPCVGGRRLAGLSVVRSSDC